MDGATPMTFVSGVTSVTVLTGGTGYYVDSPSVAFVYPNGASGTAATGTVATNGSSITGITITSGGTGYAPVVTTATITTGTGSRCYSSGYSRPGWFYIFHKCDSAAEQDILLLIQSLLLEHCHSQQGI